MRYRDEYSPFRLALKRCRNKRIRKNRSNRECTITLQDLKEVWDSQNGICPLTGWKMILPTCLKCKERKYIKNIRAASVDRIDNDVGYTKENIRFVCRMANDCRNAFEDKDVIEFCEAVVKNVPLK